MTYRSSGVRMRTTHEPAWVLANQSMGRRSLEFSEPQRRSGKVDMGRP
jgi:hypothetical protein